jgi:multidrug efflux pump
MGAVIKSDPAVSAAAVGVGNNATNTGFVYIALKPLNERNVNASELITRLRRKLAAVPGAMTFLQAGQDVRIGGRQSNAQYQYTIQSENLRDLTKWGPVVLAEIRKLPGFTDVNSDQQNAGLQASLTYDRQTAARLGISAQMIDDTLYDAFGQRQVSTMFTSLNQYHVVMEVDPSFWQDPKSLDAIYLRPATAATTSQPSPTPANPGSSSSVASSAASAPFAGATPSFSPAAVELTEGPLAVPTPANPVAILQGPTPVPASTPVVTPSGAVNSSPSAVVSTLSPIPATSPGSLLTIPTSTPAITPLGTIAGLTLGATNPASTSGGDGTSQPTTSPTPVVPLSAIASYQPSTAPIAVNHQGQFPSVTIAFNLAGGMALSDAVSAIQQMQQRIGMPSAVHGNFSGTAQAFQTSLASEPFLIVLGILYESYIHPITILSTLPSASVGAILALMLFRTELSMIALIGILLLIGIVKKNAILMVDFALEAERTEGMRPRDAIYQACLLRFRPILMTTTAALFGALPLILSNGMGSELRRPLGITIAGGLIFSQALTLYTTPVVYLYFDRLREWRQSRRGNTVGSTRSALGLPEPV